MKTKVIAAVALALVANLDTACRRKVDVIESPVSRDTRDKLKDAADYARAADEAINRAANAAAEDLKREIRQEIRDRK